MPVIETRYAEALFSIVPSSDIADRIETVLAGFSDVLSGHEDLRDFLFNPVISKDVKKDTIQKILADDAIPQLLHFFFLLLDKERLELLPVIHREYQRIKDKWQGNLDIKVYSAEVLEESHLLKIREKYRDQYGASTAHVENCIDPSLIGGVRIKIGDTYIDDTLRSRLKGLLSFIENPRLN